MNTFKQNLEEKSNSELVKMLDNCHQLTINSKKNLYSFLKSKSDFENDKLNVLEAELAKHESDLDNLKYLRNLGFAIEEENNSIKVRRSKTAKTYDIVGIIVGAFLLINLLTFIQIVKVINENGGDIITYVNAGILLILGVLGFILFYKSFNRYMEFIGFVVIKNSSGLIVKKQGIDNIESILSSNQLMFRQDENMACLYLNDDDSKPIIVSKTNPIFHETLKVLHRKLT